MRSVRTHESPVELRFVDLFLMIVAALVLVTVSVLARGLGEGAPPRITSRALPVAAAGVLYEVPLAATGGAQPLRWEIVGGSLPSGLAMGLDGLIQGSALSEGTAVARVAVIDAEDRRDERDLAVEVHRAPAHAADVPTAVRIPTAAIWLDGGVTGRPYSATLGTAGEPVRPSGASPTARSPPGSPCRRAACYPASRMSLRSIPGRPRSTRMTGALNGNGSGRSGSVWRRLLAR